MEIPHATAGLAAPRALSWILSEDRGQIVAPDMKSSVAGTMATCMTAAAAVLFVQATIKRPGHFRFSTSPMS